MNHLCLWLLRHISQYVNMPKEMLIRDHQRSSNSTALRNYHYQAHNFPTLPPICCRRNAEGASAGNAIFNSTFTWMKDATCFPKYHPASGHCIRPRVDDGPKCANQVLLRDNVKVRKVVFSLSSSTLTCSMSTKHPYPLSHFTCPQASTLNSWFYDKRIWSTVQGGDQTMPGSSQIPSYSGSIVEDLFFVLCAALVKVKEWGAWCG